MAEFTPFPACSFCHKQAADVELLIVSPFAAICNECVDLVVDTKTDWRQRKAVCSVAAFAKALFE
jgi:ATP-dependent protease Clp ATPase subunit